MADLVEDLLLLAQLDEGRPIEHDAVDLAEVAVEAVDAAARRRTRSSGGRCGSTTSPS